MADDAPLFLIKDRSSIRDALKQLGSGPEKVLFVVDADNRLQGSLSDGDIRRWILGGGRLDRAVREIANPQPFSVTEDPDMEAVKRALRDERYIAVPIVDAQRRVVSVLSWLDVFGFERRKERQLTIPVVVMAGGRGTRMDPFTKILPKPLVPIGDTPILQIIMDTFSEYGVSDFYVTLNYKGEVIKACFDSMETGYNLHYVWEEEPLGTAGSLKLLRDQIAERFFVSNCDNLVKADFSDILRYHKKRKSQLTIVGSMRHVEIPYGVAKISEGGVLEDLDEKPEYDLLVNTGVYLLERDVLSYIPEHGPFDMTQLVDAVKADGGRVLVYPVNHESWVDLGQWEKYKRHLRDLDIL